MVGFAIATAALKSGAGAPQVIAYSIAWALFALQRVLVFEIPDDAAARGVAARRRLAAAAVSRRVDGDAGREAVNSSSSSSAKADDPVIATLSILRYGGVYWVPAFAGHDDSV